MEPVYVPEIAPVILNQTVVDDRFPLVNAYVIVELNVPFEELLNSYPIGAVTTTLFDKPFPEIVKL